jgi:hypothetical protein
MRLLRGDFFSRIIMPDLGYVGREIDLVRGFAGAYRGFSIHAPRDTLGLHEQLSETA